MSRQKPPRYYPVFLDLRGRDCLVVGGGRVAERKALSLIEAGAAVTVVSPGLTPRLKKEKAVGRISHRERKFRDTDLRGVFLVIAATDDEEDNQKIGAAGGNLLANVVDRPELCSFIVPSSVRRGPLQIAVSTSGASPAMAKAIREEMESLYGPAFGTYIKRAGTLRARAMKGAMGAKEREAYLKSLGSREIIDSIRKGGLPIKRKKSDGTRPKATGKGVAPRSGKGR